VISSNKLANKIGEEQKSNYSVEIKSENNPITDFLPQWIFFAVIALIPNIISFLIKIKKGDTLMTFFEDHRILYVSSTYLIPIFRRK
jgi:hypothetical protein